MKTTLFAYLGALVLLSLGDLLWLGVLMPAKYQSWIGPLLLEQPRLVPAAIFYFLYPVGLVVFAILPALKLPSARRAVALSALFGLLAYGTYDLSNLATLKPWSVELTLVDMAWGTFLSAVAGAAGYFAAQAGAKLR